MACKPPYKVGTAAAGSPVGSIDAIFPCCLKVCPNGYRIKPTGCLSPCGDYYNLSNEWQCYSSFIDAGPYSGYAIINVLPPATNYLSMTLYAYRNWGYYFPTRYSTQVFFEDLCCVTKEFSGTGGQFIAANSGTYRIKMAKWPRYYVNFFGGVTYIDNPVENPPPMEDKGYLRTTLPPPYQSPEFCGVQINPNYGSLPDYDPTIPDGEGFPEGAVLTRSSIQFVAVTIVFGNDCSIKYYYGYHEIPINAGDSFVTKYTVLPLEIPSFRWYAGGFGAYDTPAVSLPFMSEMTPENDAGAWGLLSFYNTGGCLNYGGTLSGPNPGGILQKACANARPMTMAFRRRMIQNKITSRIKKIHYKT
jgi:hypothetical protein